MHQGQGGASNTNSFGNINNKNLIASFGVAHQPSQTHYPSLRMNLNATHEASSEENGYENYNKASKLNENINEFYTCNSHFNRHSLTSTESETSRKSSSDDGANNNLNTLILRNAQLEQMAALHMNLVNFKKLDDNNAANDDSVPDENECTQAKPTELHRLLQFQQQQQQQQQQQSQEGKNNDSESLENNGDDDMDDDENGMLIERQGRDYLHRYNALRRHTIGTNSGNNGLLNSKNIMKSTECLLMLQEGSRGTGSILSGVVNNCGYFKQRSSPSDRRNNNEATSTSSNLSINELTKSGSSLNKDPNIKYRSHLIHTEMGLHHYHSTDNSVNGSSCSNSFSCNETVSLSQNNIDINNNNCTNSSGENKNSQSVQYRVYHSGEDNPIGSIDCEMSVDNSSAQQSVNSNLFQQQQQTSPSSSSSLPLNNQVSLLQKKYHKGHTHRSKRQNLDSRMQQQQQQQQTTPQLQQHSSFGQFLSPPAFGGRRASDGGSNISLFNQFYSLKNAYYNNLNNLNNPTQSPLFQQQHQQQHRGSITSGMPISSNNYVPSNNQPTNNVSTTAEGDFLFYFSHLFI
jgi:hypothetical protein